jgi:hypothetical protein
MPWEFASSTSSCAAVAAMRLSVPIAVSLAVIAAQPFMGSSSSKLSVVGLILEVGEALDHNLAVGGRRDFGQHHGVVADPAATRVVPLATLTVPVEMRVTAGSLRGPAVS